MRFIGLDLAWSDRNNTAASVLELSRKDSAVLVHYQERLQGDAEIIEYILSMSQALLTLKQVQGTDGQGGACVAIDAPLIVRNKEGARPVDREITRRFGRYGAGAHPCNLEKFPRGVRGERLMKGLSRHGFLHQPLIDRLPRRKGMKTVFEVYPHPAQVILFGLSKRILYKKGGVETRRRGLVVLQDNIRAHLLRLKPRLRSNPLLTRLLNRNTDLLKGRELKCYEDTLDSLICAYIGLYHWYWGEERSEVVGDMESGYMVIPRSGFDRIK
jgi:predicted RNase H-like nuclease